jgi:UDP-N-acetylmuramoyl-L-alanyl-D-glutamate--2,6-diaminopimelate ligase
MKLSALMQKIPYTVIQTGDATAATSITIDSRKVKPGALFICIRGFKMDSHRFIDDVAVAGAAAVLIDACQEYYPPGLTVIKVDNTRSAMSHVAANFYGHPAKKMRLIGVTGTNGKTSTTYFIETMLEAAGFKAGVIGTIGTRVGREIIDVPFDTVTTPDPLELQQILAEMRGKGATEVVMEVSSHALSLHKTEGLLFDVGVFTNITQDHMDFHGTMDNYREAKARLFTQSKAGVLNADDASMPVIRGDLHNYMLYSLEKPCDLHAVNIDYLPEGSSFDVKINGKFEKFYLPVKGRFNIYNALAAIGTGLTLGIPVAAIQKAVGQIRGIPGRIQSVPNDKGAHILVDYAHSPDGIANIINAAREFTDGRLITLFGCGGDKDKTKRPVMGRIAGELSDYCIITSDNPRSEPPEIIIQQIEDGLRDTNTPYEIHINRMDAIQAGVKMLTAGDTLIIAGKGHETVQIIGNESIPFDDYKIVAEMLEKLSCD